MSEYEYDDDLESVDEEESYEPDPVTKEDESKAEDNKYSIDSYDMEEGSKKQPSKSPEDRIDEYSIDDVNSHLSAPLNIVTKPVEGPAPLQAVQRGDSLEYGSDFDGDSRASSFDQSRASGYDSYNDSEATTPKSHVTESTYGDDVVWSREVEETKKQLGTSFSESVASKFQSKKDGYVEEFDGFSMPSRASSHASDREEGFEPSSLDSHRSQTVEQEPEGKADPAPCAIEAPAAEETIVKVEETKVQESLNPQQQAIARLQNKQRTKSIQHEKEMLKLCKKMEEIEGAIKNPNDPTNMLLQTIKRRKEFLGKKRFLASNLAKVERDLTDVRRQLDGLQAGQEHVKALIATKQETDEANTKNSELEMIFNMSNNVVEEGRKNMEVSNRIVKMKVSIEKGMSDMMCARGLVIQAIGKKAKVTDGMTLPDLLEVYESVMEEEKGEAGREEEGGREEGEGHEEDADKIQQVEKNIAHVQNENKLIEIKLIQVQTELQSLDTSWQDIQQLKSKAAALKQRKMAEREGRVNAERMRKRTSKKILLLSAHVEKLMVHIKHEAIAKLRAEEKQRAAVRELELLKIRSAELAKKSSARDRLIIELKQGAKLLEDQLRLMDTRYLELRGKLDYTKNSSETLLKNARGELFDMRARWSYVKERMEGWGEGEEGVKKGLEEIVGRAPATKKAQGKKKRRRKVQYEYPKLSEVMRAPDPEAVEIGKANLWSGQKIQSMKQTLKHFQKRPVKLIE